MAAFGGCHKKRGQTMDMPWDRLRPFGGRCPRPFGTPPRYFEQDKDETDFIFVQILKIGAYAQS